MSMLVKYAPTLVPVISYSRSLILTLLMASAFIWYLLHSHYDLVEPFTNMLYFSLYILKAQYFHCINFLMVSSHPNQIFCYTTYTSVKHNICVLHLLTKILENWLFSIYDSTVIKNFKANNCNHCHYPFSLTTLKKSVF